MQKMKHVPIIALPLGALFFAAVIWFAWHTQEQQREEVRPDFSTINDVKIKKRAFFDYMLPKVQRANDQIIDERRRLLEITDSIEQSQELSSRDREWLQSLALNYRVKADPTTNEQARQELVNRVDTIPASLVLAQAANESAWGTARFARVGNNFFGIWCWVRNCGMVPTERAPDRKHEVASFDTVDAGVRYYLLTLNSHPAYADLRDIRSEARENQKTVTGIALAAGLQRYSERGAAYIREIRSMIRVNHLSQFNRELQ